MLHAKPEFKQQYENYIGGKWTPPVEGNYFDDISSGVSPFFPAPVRATPPVLWVSECRTCFLPRTRSDATL